MPKDLDESLVPFQSVRLEEERLEGRLEGRELKWKGLELKKKILELEEKLKKKS